MSAHAELPGAGEYLRGRKAEGRARYTDAREAYKACAEKAGPLAPYALVRDAVCRGRLGDAEGAGEALDAVVKAHPEGPWVRMALAERAFLHEKGKRPMEAATLYGKILWAPLPRTWDERYRKAAAECLMDAKQAEAARGLYRDVYDLTRSRSTRLEVSRKLAASPDVDDRLVAAMGFVRTGRYTDAGKLLAQLAPGIGEDSEFWARHRYLQGRALLGQKQITAGRALLAEVGAADTESVWGRRALSYLARNLARGGKKEEAANHLDALAARAPRSEETGEALHGVACLLADKGDTRGALKHHLRLGEVHPGHADAAISLLLAARAQKRLGDTKGALATYERLAKVCPKSSLVARAWYERGVLRVSQKDREGAVADLRKAAAGEIGDYYVHRALERLLQLGEKPSREVGATLKLVPGGSFLRPLAPERAEVEEERPVEAWVERLQFFGAQGVEEGEWEAVHVANLLLGTDDPAPVYEAMARAGFAWQAMWLVSENEWAPEEGEDAAAARRVRYPLAYWPIVKAVAAEEGVDPLLLLAFARQESYFRANAKSYVGAYGVMQLMPDTAKWLAEVDGRISKEHAANLGVPGNSLRLGARYLGRMLERYDGNFVHAVASYNAGPGNVNKWLRRQPGVDAETFVETIPFTETRNFVRKVLGNYAAYRSIYPGEAAG